MSSESLKVGLLQLKRAIEIAYTEVGEQVSQREASRVL